MGFMMLVLVEIHGEIARRPGLEGYWAGCGFFVLLPVFL